MTGKTLKQGLAVAIAALAAAVALAACGSSDSDSDKVTVTDPWVRVTAPKQTNSAAYMTVESKDGDMLTAASVPTSLAQKTELHETTSSDKSMGDSMEGSSDKSMGDSMGDSMKGMKPVSSIELPAGQQVKLEPGGYHVMLIDLAKPITDGEKIPVTLTFEKAGKVTVEAVGREG